VHKFTSKEIAKFLTRVEAELTSACSIVVIGGGAVGLKYKTEHATTDVDLWAVSDPRFWAAAKRVNAAMRPQIPVQKATIAEPPYNFEDRLIPLALPGLRKLTVLVPEAHDLVLLKVARAEAHDLDAIEDVHASHPLDLAVLLERYIETKTQVIGSVTEHRLNFLAAIARLFGEATAEEADERLTALEKQ
jgi:Nucleotidyltransferase of unknown function (DUF6036)